MSEDEVGEILEGEFTLDIPSFEKWNPPIVDKKTGAAHQNQMRNYVKVSIHFFDDPRVRSLSEVDTVFFLKLIMMRARSGRGVCMVGARYLRDTYKVRGRSVRGAILKLLNLQLIVISKERKKELKEKKEEAAPLARTALLPVAAPKNEPAVTAPPPKILVSDLEPETKLTPLQLYQLEKHFTPELVKRCLPDAVAHWETKLPHERQNCPLILTVHRYLRIERDRPAPPRVRTLAEMAEAGELENDTT